MKINEQKNLFLLFLTASIILHLGFLLYQRQRDIQLNAAPLSNALATLSMKINIQKPLMQQETRQKQKRPKNENLKQVKTEIAKKVQAPQGPIITAPQTTTKNFDALINHYTQPRYPRLAIRRGLTGVVTLTLWIKGDGLVDKVELTKSSGYKSLDNSALDAAKRWKFKKLSTAIEQTALYKVEKRIIYQLD